MTYRLKPQVEHELEQLKKHLMFLVKLGAATSENAFNAYMDACRQVSRKEHCFEVDTREWSPIKCRACGRTSSVLSGTAKYSCVCSPTVPREAFLDMVGRDGSYLITDSVPLKETDKSVKRKQALMDGATLSEADAIL